MKKKIIFMLGIGILLLSGCSKKDTAQTEQNPQGDIDKSETKSSDGYWYETIKLEQEKKIFDSWIFSSYLNQFPIDPYQLDQEENFSYSSWHGVDEAVYTSLKDASERELEEDEEDGYITARYHTGPHASDYTHLGIDYTCVDKNSHDTVADIIANGQYSLESNYETCLDLSSYMGIEVAHQTENHFTCFDAVIDRVGSPTSLAIKKNAETSSVSFSLIYEYDDYVIAIGGTESLLEPRENGINSIYYYTSQSWETQGSFDKENKDPKYYVFVNQ